MADDEQVEVLIVAIPIDGFRPARGRLLPGSSDRPGWHQRDLVRRRQIGLPCRPRRVLAHDQVHQLNRAVDPEGRPALLAERRDALGVVEDGHRDVGQLLQLAGVVEVLGRRCDMAGHEIQPGEVCKPGDGLAAVGIAENDGIDREARQRPMQVRLHLVEGSLGLPVPWFELAVREQHRRPDGVGGRQQLPLLVGQHLDALPNVGKSLTEIDPVAHRGLEGIAVAVRGHLHFGHRPRVRPEGDHRDAVTRIDQVREEHGRLADDDLLRRPDAPGVVDEDDELVVLRRRLGARRQHAGCRGSLGMRLLGTGGQRQGQEQRDGKCEARPENRPTRRWRTRPHGKATWAEWCPEGP